MKKRFEKDSQTEESADSYKDDYFSRMTLIDVLLYLKRQNLDEVKLRSVNDFIKEFLVRKPVVEIKYFDKTMDDQRLTAELLKKNFAALFFEVAQLKLVSEKAEVLATVQRYLDSFQEASKPCSSLSLPEPDGNYERYQPRTDALEHLQRVWGKYLTYFGAKEDVLFQQDLRRLDEDLMVALDNQIRYKNRTGKMTDKVCDVIKPLEEKINKELSHLSLSNIKKSASLYQAVRYRSLQK